MWHPAGWYYEASASQSVTRLIAALSPLQLIECSLWPAAVNYLYAPANPTSQSPSTLKQPNLASVCRCLLVINALQKLADASASFLEIAVFVAVDLLVLQRFHEGLAGRVVVRIALAAHADLDLVLLQ